MHHNEDGSWLGFEPENIAGYLSVSVTGALIFGLYSGGAYMGGENTNTVLVFTWDGKPLAVLQVARGAVSPDASEFFVLYKSPVPLIMRYTVPTLVSGKTV